MKLEFFEPPSCPNSTNIGINCNISIDLCQMTKPCLNNGTCYKNDANLNDYNCSCSADFFGKNCQFYKKSCRNHICLNDGLNLIKFYKILFLS